MSAIACRLYLHIVQNKRSGHPVRLAGASPRDDSTQEGTGICQP